MTPNHTFSSSTTGGSTTFFRRGDFPLPLTNGTGPAEIDDFTVRVFGASPYAHPERNLSPVREKIEKNFESLTSTLVSDDRLSSVNPATVREYLSWLKDSPTIREGIKLLESEIGKRQDLHYHASSHTWDVLREYSVIALREGLPAEQLRLGAVASVFHDLGFIEKNGKNEPFAAACLVSFHDSFQREFKDADGRHLREIVHSILDTRPLPVSGKKDVYVAELTHGPHERIAACLLDADVANFGRTDFIDKTPKVYAELRNLPVVPSMQEMLLGGDSRDFVVSTYEMLKSHHFWTASARELFDAGKADNIAKLEESLGISAHTA